MRLPFIIIFVLAGIFLYSCNDEIPEACENTETGDKWLEKIIKDSKRNGMGVTVHQTYYEGELVFIVNGCTDCYDYITYMYNCYGEEVCKFGGIAGFNTCPEFKNQLTDYKLVYEYVP